MSSPTEFILREQAFSRPTTFAVDDQPSVQVLKEVTYRGTYNHRDDNAKKPASRNADKFLDSLLGKNRRTKKRSAVGPKKLEPKLVDYFKDSVVNVSSAENSSMRKMLAIACLANNKELEGCCHLIASHANCLRQQIFTRHLKSKIRGDVCNQPMVINLNPDHLDVDNNNSITNPKSLMSTLRELPSEWYVLQVTAEHEHFKDTRQHFQQEDYTYSLKSTHGIHLVVIPTGKNAMNPICITVPKPNININYDIRVEIEILLNRNKSDLTNTYSNKDLYWRMRKRQNEKMNQAIRELEYSWLREWRILLLADYTEHLDLVQDIHNMIDKLIADSSVKSMSERTRWLLKKIASEACHLEPFEVERAVKHILPTQTKLAKNIILSIVAKVKVMKSLKNAKRKTLLLILDECLDHISFESMQLLKHQPVTRFPSLHILYALFKHHESSIKDGFKIIPRTENFGTFIVNPSLDLKSMEFRIKTFIDYWLPQWQGLCGVKPTIEDFKKALTDFDILMYNGHGSGIQFIKGEDIERMRVIATVLLFGCSSIKLLPLGGRQAPFGVSNQYLMACSPCMLGMLWEVTDGDIDRMTTEFMSSWIPSKSKNPWSEVSQDLWSKETKKKVKPYKGEIKNEQDMLIAVAKSKDVCKQYMTSAAIIARGLPVKYVS